MKNEKGFTLIELLAVIIILAVILVIAVPRVIDSVKKSKNDSRKISAEQMVKSAKVSVLEDGKEEWDFDEDDICEDLVDNVCDEIADGEFFYNDEDDSIDGWLEFEDGNTILIDDDEPVCFSDGEEYTQEAINYLNNSDIDYDDAYDIAKIVSKVDGKDTEPTDDNTDDEDFDKEDIAEVFDKLLDLQLIVQNDFVNKVNNFKPNGDINGDGFISTSDIAIIISNKWFNKSCTDKGFTDTEKKCCSKYLDINLDGKIDDLDKSILLSSDYLYKSVETNSGNLNSCLNEE